MGLIGRFASVGSATLASRFLGFFREVMIAALLGTGPVADAFYAAFRFPNLFRRLFAEGAFNAAFVPLFAGELENGGREAARKFAEQVLAALLAVLLVISALAMLAMPFLVETIIASRFDPASEKFDLTVVMTRIMFPYLTAMSLVALMSGVLNTFRRYFLAAFAPVLLNVAMIAALVYASLGGMSEREIGYVLSWTVSVSGLLQLAMLIWGVRREGFGLTLRWPAWTPAVGRLLVLAIPAAITGGITQINLLVGQNIASAQEGAIALINYADRLFQLPLGVITNAIGVVLLAELSRAIQGGDEAEASKLQAKSLEFGLALVLPAAVGFMLLPDALIAIVYERGGFTRADTLAAAGVLAGFAAGLAGFTLISIFRPAFYARKDMRTPMWGAAINAVVNIVGSLILFPRIGVAGIAIATSVAGWANALFLMAVLWRNGRLTLPAATLRRLALLLAINAALAAGLWLAHSQLGAIMLDGTLGLRLLTLLGVIAISVVAYFSLALATGAMDTTALKAAIRRRRKAKDEPAT